MAKDTFDEISRKAKVPRAQVLEDFGERAAIREYLGGMPRISAELAALRDVESMYSTPLRFTGGAHFVPDGDGMW